jgi:hypothetical protein
VQVGQVGAGQVRGEIEDDSSNQIKVLGQYDNMELEGLKLTLLVQTSSPREFVK